jgi:hypothetical protein
MVQAGVADSLPVSLPIGVIRWAEGYRRSTRGAAGVSSSRKASPYLRLPIVRLDALTKYSTTLEGSAAIQ